MARPARFTADDILDGAARALLSIGPSLTIADIARAIEGPSGSIYHRFASREELLGRLWLRSIGRFHEDLLEAMALPDPWAAIAASARCVPDFCRRHPAQARSMLLFSRARLLEAGPASLREDARGVNDAIDEAQVDLAQRAYGAEADARLEVLSVAIRQSPYGITRPFIGREMPPWLDDAVVAASLAIARLEVRPD
ncbi:TetR/AcrR family transcriptional regulator [Brachybacterium endophyticum]|uniref:TetR/AcrR family transcriptional regulator n=1 Tax=Brachybacterium endophyticum TaxID=2182385 RepID=A0A2U2RPN2_9MICO|nr:TetR/AcrR family transcriptional regulator [Brachybacterium endophyticum]PWH07724.1 TetR/AcrR family transcriptional regulator [Brachybacterium endophyticum]